MPKGLSICQKREKLEPFHMSQDKMVVVRINLRWEVTVIVFPTVRLWETKHSLLYLEEMIILDNTESVWLKYNICLFSLTREKAVLWGVQSHQSNCRGCDD